MMQKQRFETNSQPVPSHAGVTRFLNWLRTRAPRQRFVQRFAGTILLLGVTLAYEPALGDGTIWTLPYQGSASTDHAAFAVTNTGTSQFSFLTPTAIQGTATQHNTLGIYGLNTGSQGVGMMGEATSQDGRGVVGTASFTGSTNTGIGVQGSGDTGVYGSGLSVGVRGGSAMGYGVIGLTGFVGSTSIPPPVFNGVATSAGVYGASTGTTPAVGVWGRGALTFPGVFGTNDIGTALYGISGIPGGTTGTYGVYGVSNGINSNGVFSAAGVFGSSITTTAVAGVSASPNDPAVYGVNTNSGAGTWGQSKNGYGVYGYTERAEAAGVYGTNAAGGAAVIGIGNSTQSPSGYFRNDNGFLNAVGLQGQCNAGLGVVGYGRVGVYGAPLGNGGYAGYFQGDVQVTGTLSAATKHFKIDHPLDPAHKYLVHASVESSEQLNTYSGNTLLDSDGKATIDMPEWFQAENSDCRYQLTCVGGYAPVYVDREMDHNQFAIAGGKPGLKVSWQVTAVRADAYAKHHPLQVEQEKTGTEAGKYLNPEDFGKPRKEAIGAERNSGVKPNLTAANPPATRFVTPNLRYTTPRIPVPTNRAMPFQR